MAAGLPRPSSAPSSSGFLPRDRRHPHSQQGVLLRQPGDSLALAGGRHRRLEGEGEQEEEQQREQRDVRVADPESLGEQLEQGREDRTGQHPEGQNEPEDRVALLEAASADQLEHQQEKEERRGRGEDSRTGGQMDRRLLGGQERSGQRRGHRIAARKRPMAIRIIAFKTKRKEGVAVR